MLPRKSKQTPPNMRFSLKASRGRFGSAPTRRRSSSASAATSCLPSHLAMARRARSAEIARRQQQRVPDFTVDEGFGLDLRRLVDELHRRDEVDVGPNEIVLARGLAHAIACPGEAAQALAFLLVFLGSQQQRIALGEILAPAQEPFVAPGRERAVPDRIDPV